MSEERILSDTVWTPERGLAEPEVRGISWENFLLSDDKYLGKWKTDSGVRVTPETALQSTVVLACCRILAETISGLPINVYRRNEDGGDEVARGIPLHKVLSFAPNEWQTKPEFFEQIMMNLTLWGNSYTRIRSGKYGSVSALDNLHPSRMDVERLENGRLRYSYTDPETGRLERYTQDQIMHIRWTPEQDGVKGMVPVEIAREAIGLARACEQHAARFWANSARPGVVLTTDGTLTAEAAERLRENWERLHRGSERAHRTAVLTGGMKAQELGFTNEASQFNATRAAQTEEIARVYRVSLHLIQGTSGGDLETQGQEFVTYTLMPWLNRIEAAISRSLIVDDDAYYAKFDVRGLLRANSQQRASYYSTMINLGVMTINDVRKHEGMKSLGEIGDHHFVPMNTQTLEDATKPKEDPPAVGPGMPPPGPPAGGGGGGDDDGPPKPAPGGPPSMSEVKTGAPPAESPKGEASKPKEEASAEWEEAVEERAFCPTGKGGGVKNDCSPSQATKSREILRLKGEKQSAAKKKVEELSVSTPGSVPSGHDLLINHVDFVPSTSSANSSFVSIPSDEKLAAAMGGNAVADKSDSKKANIGGVAGKSISAGDSWIGFHRDLPDGTQVAFRIDIPTFNRTKGSGSPVYAVTIHEDDGKLNTSVGDRIGYDAVARMSGPVSFLSNEKNSMMIAAGVAGKNPIATVKGKFDRRRDVPADIDSWTPVGYDPQKAAYFYDKKSGQEVTGGNDALSVGNTVFTRQPKYGPRNAKTHYRSEGEMFSVDSWGIESRSLSAANQDLYIAQEEIVEENGKWPQADAHYMDQNPFASRGMKCSNCLYYGAGQCEIVTGSVSPDGICKLWIIPEEKISSPEQRAFCPTGPGNGVDNSCSRYSNAGGEAISKLLEKIAASPDGFTLDPHSAEQPKSGIMVSEFQNDSVRSVKIKASEIKSPQAMRKLSQWYSKNKDLLVGQANRFVGGWKTGDDFYIDVATRFDPGKAPEALEAGREAGQLAVFNLGTFKETWVQYESKDKRKPAGYDKEFARARRDSQVKQVYDVETPDLQEEDWADELSRHGKTTVRSYNGPSQEDASDDRQSAAVRHSEQANDHRGLPRDESVFRADSGGERREARSCLVRRRAGGVPVALGGSAGDPESGEERSGVDCGRSNGGIFGPGNKCQAAGVDSGWKKSDAPAIYRSKDLKKSPPCRALAGVKEVTIINGKALAGSLKETGVTLNQAAKACAPLTSDAKVDIAHGTLSEISEYMGDEERTRQVSSSVTFTSRRSIAGINDGVLTSVSLTRTDEEELLMTYSMLHVNPEAQRAAPVAIAREVYKGVAESITAAQKIGVTEVMMLAAGNKDDDEMKGYRIWPRLGFDGIIPRGLITPRYSAKKGIFESYGSKIPDSVLSKSAVEEKKKGKLTIQSLYETKEGQRWWEENGNSMPMSLRIGSRSDKGWKRFTQIRDKIAARSFDDVLEVLDVEWRSIREEVESRAYCPTGPGGGIDNSCGGGASRPAIRVGDAKEAIDSRLGGLSLTMDQAVRAAGGKGKNLSVFVRRDHESTDGDGIHIESERDVAGVERGIFSVSVVKNVGTKESPEVVVEHKLIDVTNDVKSDPAKRHAAAREFYRSMVTSAIESRKAGVSKLVLNAAGSPKAAGDGFFKGYTIWPRMGFDAPIPRRQAVSLPPSLAHCRTLLDLHATKEGTNWWKKNGEDVDVQLDLRRADSAQMKVFQKFASRFGTDKRSEQAAGDGSGWLSPADEAKIEALWEEIWSEGILLSVDHSEDDFSRINNRAFCPTGPGGGVKNTCGSGSSTAHRPGKPASVQVSSQQGLSDAMSQVGLKSVDDVVAIGGGNVRGASVAVKGDSDGSILVSSTWPVEKDNASSGQIHTSVSVSRGEDGPELGFESFGPTGDAITSPSKQQKVISLISEKVAESISTAENSGFARVTTFAIGDANNPYKGYRLWPQFGFDAPVPRDIAKKIPAEIVLKAKKVDIPAKGSTQIPHELVLKGLASRFRDISIQELISSREGDRWWDRNGSDVNLTLDLRDKGSIGYKRWEQMKSKLPRLKDRNKTRSFFDAFAEERGCGQEPDGKFGSGNTCAAKGGAKGSEKPRAAKKSSEKKAKVEVVQVSRNQFTPVANITRDTVSSPPTVRSEDGKKIESTSITDRSSGGIYSFGGREYVSTVEVGRHLSEKQASDRGGVTIDTSKPLSGGNREYVVASHVQQVASAGQRGIKPVFYTKEERERQLSEFSVMEPKIFGGKAAAGFEVTPENAEFVFRAVQAVTSSNASPKANMQRTQSVLDKFFNGDGRVATSTSYGVTGEAIKKSLSRLQTIVDRLGKTTSGSVDTEMGLSKARELFVGKTMRAGDVDAFFRSEVGVGGSKNAWKPSNYLVDQNVPMFTVFGPKFGTFFANNNGELDHLTADIWATRTFGRVTGELIQEPKQAKSKEHAAKTLKVIKNASSDMLHGYDGNQLVESLKRVSATGEMTDIVRGWAGERLRHYARGDFNEKRGVGGKLNKLAKNIVENDVSLMGTPGSGTRRANMIDVYAEVSKRTGLPIAHAQDVLWQDEQDAYAAAGAKTVTDVGVPSFYSDVIREIAADPDKRFPRAKKEKRSISGVSDGFYDDFERGGMENILFLEAISSMSDEDFADRVLRLADGGSLKSRSVSISVASAVFAEVSERRSAGESIITMPSSGRKGLHVMGFDAEIPHDLVAALPESLSHCKTLLDLHVSEGGSLWWEQNGRDIDVSIDLGGVQGRLFDGFAAGKPFDDIIEEGILDDYGNS